MLMFGFEAVSEGDDFEGTAMENPTASAEPPPNQGINLPVDSVPLALPLQSGAFNGRLSRR